MKIFIAGASGFIGTHLVKRLAQTKHDLYCLVRKTSNVQYLKDLGVTLVDGDVTDKNSLYKGMEGCQWVVNAANIYSYWEPDVQAYTEVNIKGTRNIMECVLDTGVSKVVHLSTAAVYPGILDDIIGTGGPKRTIVVSKYNRTKYVGDKIAWKLCETRNLPLVMLYLGNVLGPGDPKPTGQHIRNILQRRVRVRAFESYVATYVHVKNT
jgi:dihydroflavonol-4-reductase